MIVSTTRFIGGGGSNSILAAITQMNRAGWYVHEMVQVNSAPWFYVTFYREAKRETDIPTVSEVRNADTTVDL